MEPDTSALADLADEAVALIDRQGGARHREGTVEANVRVTRTRHGLTRFANAAIHQHVAEDTTTVSCTIALDGQTATGSTTRCDPAGLRATVDAVLAAAAQQPVDPAWPGATPPTPVTPRGAFDPPTAQGDPTVRAEGVARFVDAGAGLSAAGYLDTHATWAACASSAGHRAADAATRATIDGIHQTPTSAGSGHATALRVADLDPAAVGTRAADLAGRSASFVELAPARFEVVLAPEAVATLLTFLAVYGFNAKAVLDGASFAEPGTMQFDPAITLLDDPGDPGAIGVGFDAEGSPRQRTTLVTDGVTTSLVHDRRTALRAGAHTTGGAIPGGERVGAVPHNLRMPAGTTTPDDLIAGVERGLLITTFNYVRVLEPKRQQVTGLTRNGTFLIEDGTISGAVGNLRFTDSFLDALAPGRVLGVGNDARLADAEFGPGMVTCPSLRLADFAFTGGAAG